MPAKILVVDDDPNDLQIFRKTFSSAFKDTSLTLDEARKGSIALEKIKTNHYLCIFMDIHMPGMDGTETVRLVRKQERETGEHVPIIAYSSFGVADVQRKCFEAGMDKFVSKHMPAAAMKELVERYLESSIYKTEPEESKALSILIVEDAGYAELLEQVLLGLGHEAKCTENGVEAMKEFERKQYDICLVDVHMQEMDGITFLKLVKEKYPEAIVLIMTGLPTVKLAINSFKNGAFDFLEKPINFRELKSIIEHASQARHSQTKGNFGKLERLERSLSNEDSLNIHNIIIGENPEVTKLIDYVEKLTTSNKHILIEGEDGTLKKSVAEYLHYKSDNHTFPLVIVDASQHDEETLWEKLIAQEGNDENPGSALCEAVSGTLILLNIHTIPMPVQTAFSKVLENSSQDFRLISTSSHNLDALMDGNNFDLSLSLQLTLAAPIQIPPVRKHLDDLPRMVSHYAKKAYNPYFETESIKISPAAMDLMKSYAWPGNHMELVEVVTSLVATTKTETIDVSQLPYYISPLNEWPPLPVLLARYVSKYVKFMLRSTNNDRKLVADFFHVSDEDLQEIEAGHIHPISVLNELLED